MMQMDFETLERDAAFRLIVFQRVVRPARIALRASFRDDADEPVFRWAIGGAVVKSAAQRLAAEIGPALSLDTKPLERVIVRTADYFGC